MSTEDLTRLATSIRQRLLNIARERGEDFQLILSRFGVERLLYRLSQSKFTDRYYLKGSSLFMVWTGAYYRPTRDVDFLGFGDAEPEVIADVFRKISSIEVADGLIFDLAAIRAEYIREQAAYDGVRIKLVALLGNTRIPIQADVGFGDVVVPGPEIREFPVLLDLPVPRVSMYSHESVVAEKFQALVDLGFDNSRFKDFYDLWVLAKDFPYEGRVLGAAIEATFKRRETPIPTEKPTAFTAEFIGDEQKQSQWKAFLRKQEFRKVEPELEKVMDCLAGFLLPLCVELQTGDINRYEGHWGAGGPWMPATEKGADSRPSSPS